MVRTVDSVVGKTGQTLSGAQAQTHLFARVARGVLLDTLFGKPTLPGFRPQCGQEFAESEHRQRRAREVPAVAGSAHT